MMDGVGIHEVVIESPIHNQFLPLMEDKQVGEVLLAYRERYLALREDPRIKLIIIFKNHGEGCRDITGPHPFTACGNFGCSIKYSKETRRGSAIGRVYRQGTTGGVSIVIRFRKNVPPERGSSWILTHLLYSSPLDPGSPFETWIVPKKHQASFGLISMEDSKKFAKTLKTTLLKLYSKLNNPDYNYVIHTAPVKDEQEDYYHWHLQIIPRLTNPAGFELGSGIYINVSFPEEAAQFLTRGMNVTLPKSSMGDSIPLSIG